MRIYFSAETLGFYHESIFPRAQMPKDVVLVSSDVHAAIGAGVANGKRVIAGEDGQPQLIDPTPDHNTLLAAERAWRSRTGLWRGIVTNWRWITPPTCPSCSTRSC